MKENEKMKILLAKSREKIEMGILMLNAYKVTGKRIDSIIESIKK